MNTWKVELPKSIPINNGGFALRFGLKSGLMEYPTLITTGSVYGMPNNIRTTESLVVHEFIHQYFMAVVANNEKEEPNR
ncbi:MAG: hypothetical protein IPG85_00005 [Bacteroidetes bacterium]|nr:hypothetical protein [Bacteroidota bacterium]